MNFFAKKIGKLFNFVIGGRPKAITAQSEEEEKELLDLATQASQGKEEAIDTIQSKFGSNTDGPTLLQEVKALEEQVNESREQVKSLANQLEIQDQVYSILDKHPLFTVNGKQVSLTGYKAEMPLILAEKFAELITRGESIDSLIEFWKLALLLPNAEARKGLYKFITKQKLLVLPSGYFVAFRRIVSVASKNTVQATLRLPKEKIEEFIAQAKKAKQSLHYYDVRVEGGQYFLQAVSTRRKKGDFVDSLANQAAALSFENTTEQTEVYTDAYTKTMRIEIGKPVRIPRSKCNENAHIECSNGLHVGSACYVKGHSTLGDTIVACLINPMHVISVPYADAHKMRVCEYFPAFKISDKEITNFKVENVDWSSYTRAYKKIEDKRTEKALEVFESLSEKERKEFSSTKINKSDIQKSSAELKELEKNHEAFKKQISVCLEDDISKALDINELREILKSRVEKNS